jgi:asparagine synthase (glutamine-hydrolysing)
MAWCFGLYAFFEHEETTPERVAKLSKAINICGQRIAANLDYAASQQNNHIISEAVGLFTIGTLFPEFKSAAKWQQTGKSLLEKWGRELIYDDGAFAQQSLVYHRLMLHDYLWAVRLGRLNSIEFSDELINRLRQGGLFLYQLLELSNGNAPYFGQNDGSLILPLDNGDYDDYRATVQAIAVLCDNKKWLSAGAWDELAEWLFGEQNDIKTDYTPQTDLTAEKGGYYTLRSEHGFAFVKASRFQHRPAQADQLHFDLLWQGLNIAMDAGTYAYNARPPWNNPLSSSRYHNTIIVDGKEQMPRQGRFLWLPWCRGTVKHSAHSRHLVLWQGGHNGYKRVDPSIDYDRTVIKVPHEVWIVVDRIKAKNEHHYRCHWLFNDFPYTLKKDRLELETGKGKYYIHHWANNAIPTITRADPEIPYGWRSHHYMWRTPALSLQNEYIGKNGQFITLFSPYLFRLSLQQDIQLASDSMRIEIMIKFAADSIAVELSGDLEDRCAA